METKVSKTAEPEARPRGRSSLLRIPQNNTTIVAALLVALFVGFTIVTNGRLASSPSLTVLGKFAPEVLLITMAMGLVLLIKEIDLSVGSIYVASSVVMAVAYRDGGLPIWVSALLGVGAGALMGLVNGILVVKAKVASFIVTLGTMWAFRGLMLIWVGGASIGVYPDSQGFLDVVAGSTFGIPHQVLWLGVIASLLGVVRHKTQMGSWMQAVGSNDRAARMMGVPVGKVRVTVFTLAGTLCGMAGVIQVAHSNQAVPQSGDVVMLVALAGAIIGGVTLAGGRGGVLGPLLGGLTLRVISTGLVMMGVIEYWTNVLTAVATVATAWAFLKLDTLRLKRSS